MSNGGGRSALSLQSVAESLSTSRYREQRPTRSVILKDSNPADRLRSGRHQCDCQARVHKLIRNCLSCGHIVCEQEGSGPCFFCGVLVCTREEREILERKSKKSVELYNRLMGGKDNKGGTKGAFSLASYGNALLKAEEYKSKLLEADADTERRTKVHDAEADYYCSENNEYLTKEEREAIIARKEELKEMRARRRRELVVDFDFANATCTESKSGRGGEDGGMDPVIQSILDRAQRRRPDSGTAVSSKWMPSNFVPKYDQSMGRRSKNVEDFDDDCEENIVFLQEEALYAEVERKGYAIALQQPLASLLVHGIRRHVPWNDEVFLRGPILIAAQSRRATQAEVDEEVRRCRERARSSSSDLNPEFPLDYPAGSFVGRALLTGCLTFAEYQQQYPQGECEDSGEEYVLIFSVFEPLLAPIPHLSPSRDFYRVDKHLCDVIKQILDPYSFS